MTISWFSFDINIIFIVISSNSTLPIMKRNRNGIETESKRNRNGISLFFKRKIAFFATDNHWPYSYFGLGALYCVLPRIEKGHGAAWGKRALLFAKLHFKGTFVRRIIS